MSTAIIAVRYVGDCRISVAYAWPVLRACERCGRWWACPGTVTQAWLDERGKLAFRATRHLCGPCFGLAREWVLA